MKRKKPIPTMKKVLRDESPVTRTDQNTFYVKSSNPDTEPYMVYNSMNEGWLCDCLYFTMNLTDTGSKECKHIKKVKHIYRLA